MVEAGHLAREVKEPALEMRRAATVSPIRVPVDWWVGGWVGERGQITGFGEEAGGHGFADESAGWVGGWVGG